MYKQKKKKTKKIDCFLLLLFLYHLASTINLSFPHNASQEYNHHMFMICHSLLDSIYIIVMVHAYIYIYGHIIISTFIFLLRLIITPIHLNQENTRGKNIKENYFLIFGFTLKNIKEN